MATMAFRGQEAVWPEHVELYGHLQPHPHPSFGKRQRSKKGHPEIHTVDSRKNRKGAFWEDRYHATAVETDKHLIQCLVYMDMNMVRVGVVNHPSEWTFTGYNEIQAPRERYGLIDYEG